MSFETIIETYPDDIKKLARATRDKIYETLPEVVEIVWEKQKIAGYGTGSPKMSEHFSWIQPAKKHVVLGFNYGTELPDPNKILEGTGKKFRHFKVKAKADLERKELIALIKIATTHKVPPVAK
jgi:hypothetical protein